MQISSSTPFIEFSEIHQNPTLITAESVGFFG